MSKNDEFFHKNEYLAYTKERGIIMKNIIKKSITVITVLAIMHTLAMPVTAEAAAKKAPKLNKSKVTLTITKKKTKPAVQLKVKNAAGRKVKWTSSNKKVVTVSAKGKVTAKKKGSAVITVKVKGSKTLRCKVTVKDTRKNTSNKPVACQHKWVKHYVEETVTITGSQCACGKIFETNAEWQQHRVEAGLNREYGHGSVASVDIPKTITKCDYEYCEKCGVRK
jgi:hypothetical protein